MKTLMVVRLSCPQCLSNLAYLLDMAISGDKPGLFWVDDSLIGHIYLSEAEDEEKHSK